MVVRKNTKTNTNNECNCQNREFELEWGIWRNTFFYDVSTANTHKHTHSHAHQLESTQLDFIENEECIEAFLMYVRTYDYKVFSLSGLWHSRSSHSQYRDSQWDEKCGTERLWSVRFFSDKSLVIFWPHKNTYQLIQKKWKFYQFNLI